MPSLIPMIGKLRVKLLQVANVSIHGDVYIDALVQPIDATQQPLGTQGARVRIPQHVCARPLVEGDCVELSFLMQQVCGLIILPELDSTGRQVS